MESTPHSQFTECGKSIQATTSPPIQGNLLQKEMTSLFKRISSFTLSRTPSPRLSTTEESKNSDSKPDILIPLCPSAGEVWNAGDEMKIQWAKMANESESDLLLSIELCRDVLFFPNGAVEAKVLKDERFSDHSGLLTYTLPNVRSSQKYFVKWIVSAVKKEEEGSRVLLSATAETGLKETIVSEVKSDFFEIIGNIENVIYVHEARVLCKEMVLPLEAPQSEEYCITSLNDSSLSTPAL
jgi:hypothetical protein